VNLLMCEDYEESISLESQKASCQQYSDVTIMYDNKHSVGPTISILVAILHIYLMSQSIVSGHHTFAVNDGDLEESRDYSAGKLSCFMQHNVVNEGLPYFLI